MTRRPRCSSDGATLLHISIVRFGHKPPSVPDWGGRQGMVPCDMDVRARFATEHVQQPVSAGHGGGAPWLMFDVRDHTLP
jgi:hypothetical protein